MTYAAVVLADTPAGYWPLTESSGSFAEASGGQSFTSITGPPTYNNKQLITTGAKNPGGAFQFIETPRVLDNRVDNWTIEAWVQIEADVSTVVFSIGQPSSDGYGIFISAPSSGSAGHRIQGLFGGVAFIDSGVDMTAGVPYHVVMTRSSGTTQLYVNGSAAGSTSGSTPGGPQDFALITSVANISVGHCAVYAGVLSSGRISAHYSAGTTSGPANDNFADAILLTGSSGTYNTGDNVGATGETGEPSLTGSDLTVWWKWVATGNGLLHWYSNNSVDFYFGVYTAGATPAVGSLTHIADDDDSGPGFAPDLYAPVTSGTTYYLLADAYETGAIDFSWELLTPPTNDNFADAILMTGTSGTETGTTVAASAESGEPTLGSGHSIWWYWTAPATGRASFDFAASDPADTYAGIYVAGSTPTVSGLIEVVKDDDSGLNSTSKFSFSAISGTTYYVMVDTVGGAAAISFDWDFVPYVTVGSSYFDYIALIRSEDPYMYAQLDEGVT